MNTYLLTLATISIGIVAGLAPVGGFLQEKRESQTTFCSPNVGCDVVIRHRS